MSKYTTQQKITTNKNSVVLSLQALLPILLLLIVCSLAQPAQANTIEPDSSLTVAELEKQQLLQFHSYQLWQRINEVRSNPVAELNALGIDIDQAAIALGDEAWILDQGLPPLAWNAQLGNAAELHGQDMVSRFYYSSTTPEGLSPQQRIEAQGYMVAQVDETLAVLAFPNYMDIAQAVEILLQNMLRDELTVDSGVERNIFSVTYSAVGVALKAEMLEQLVGQNYVYLLVVDVAEPLTPQHWLVGSASAQAQIAYRDNYTGFWTALPGLPGGGFQCMVGEQGGELYAFDTEGVLLQTLQVYPDSLAQRYVDWSTLYELF